MTSALELDKISYREVGGENMNVAPERCICCSRASRCRRKGVGAGTTAAEGQTGPLAL